MKKAVIYGAAQAGIAVGQSLVLEGFEIVAFIDSDPRKYASNGEKFSENFAQNAVAQGGGD